jgi:hypothetical protein
MRISLGWVGWPVVLSAAAVALAGVLATPHVASAGDGKGLDGRTQHVLLLSVDGLHSSDLIWYSTRPAALTRIDDGPILPPTELQAVQREHTRPLPLSLGTG